MASHHQDARYFQDAALLGGQFVHTPGVGAAYRVPIVASLSRRSSAAFVRDVFRNGCDRQAIIEAKGAMDAEMSHVFAQLYSYTARTLFFHDRARLTRPTVARIASMMLDLRRRVWYCPFVKFTVLTARMTC